MRFYRPITGEERIVKRFALFPIKVDSVIYWLEWVTIRQSYNTKRSGWNNDWRENV